VIVALVLAAGNGTRFSTQSNKLLEPFRGRPLVRHAVEAALASRVDETVVVTGLDAECVADALRDLPVRIVHNFEHTEGMAASLRVGLQQASNADAVVILLGDMPLVSSALIDRLIEAFDSGGASAVAPTHGGRRGNPVVLGRALFPLVARLSGDIGARAILSACDDILELKTDDIGVTLDVDTASDLSALNERCADRLA
jgi:molybdenum cofactor cytidylyltransferase